MENEESKICRGKLDVKRFFRHPKPCRESQGHGHSAPVQAILCISFVSKSVHWGSTSSTPASLSGSFTMPQETHLKRRVKARAIALQATSR
eukprot:4688975-Amphidinium_carterae.2